MPVRTADGDLVGKAVPYSAADPATPQEGDPMAGPIRTADGEPVGRTALYSVSGGVASPASIVGSDTVGQPGGPAGPLDQNGEIPLDQMPIDGLNYQGAWDASTNTPTLADGTGAAGDLYRVSVAGSQDLGSGSLTFEVGDHVIYEGAVWQQLSPPPALDYSDLSGRPIIRDSGTVALHLAGEELLWPNDITTGKIRLYNSTPGSTNTYYGFGILNQTFVYQVDGSGSTHKFQSVDGSDNAVPLLDISADSGIVAHVDLHMSEQKIVNLGDGSAPRDAVNKQQLDAATTHQTIASHSDGNDITLTPTDATVQVVDASSAVAAVVVTLPDGGATPAGKFFIIKMTDPGGNGIDINTAGGNIDGTNQIGMAAAQSFRTVVSDGTDWWVIASSGT